MASPDREPDLPRPPLFVSAWERRVAIVGLLGLGLLARVGLVVFDRSLESAIDSQTISGLVERFGLFAPVPFVTFQALQIPGYAVLAFAGGRLATHRPLEAVAVVGVFAVVAVLVYRYRESIVSLSDS